MCRWIIGMSIWWLNVGMRTQYVCDLSGAQPLMMMHFSKVAQISLQALVSK